MLTVCLLLVMNPTATKHSTVRRYAKEINVRERDELLLRKTHSWHIPNKAITPGYGNGQAS